MTERACRFDGEAFPATCSAHGIDAVLCDLGLAALRAQLDDAVKEGLRLTLQLEAHTARQQQLASWSPVSSHACPLCTYQGGKFLAPCAWHREVEAVEGHLQMVKNERDDMATRGDRFKGERDALQTRLDTNRCNSGHVTLPLTLWDCPECHNQTRAYLAQATLDMISLADENEDLEQENAALTAKVSRVQSVVRYYNERKMGGVVLTDLRDALAERPRQKGA